MFDLFVQDARFVNVVNQRGLPAILQRSPDVQSRFYRVLVNLIGFLSTAMSGIDVLTRFLVAAPFAGEAREVVLCLYHSLCEQTWNTTMGTNGNGEFVNKKVCSFLKIDCGTMTPHHPSGNGIVECERYS